jgi:hypothetical protein
LGIIEVDGSWMIRQVHLRVFRTIVIAKIGDVLYNTAQDPISEVLSRKLFCEENKFRLFHACGL